MADSGYSSSRADSSARSSFESSSTTPTSAPSSAPATNTNTSTTTAAVAAATSTTQSSESTAPAAPQPRPSWVPRWAPSYEAYIEHLRKRQEDADEIQRYWDRLEYLLNEREKWTKMGLWSANCEIVRRIDVQMREVCDWLSWPQESVYW